MLFTHIDRLQALLGLLREGSIDGMEFYQRVARIGADAVRSSRAGVWLFRDEVNGCSITCMGMYDRVRGRTTNVPDVHSSQAGLFFDALTSTGHVVADEAVSHPATRLFFEQKITQLNVRSLAATAFSVNGKVYGAFTCTQIDTPRHWTQKEIILLKRLGANASLVLREADRWLQSQKDGHGLPVS
ncbi:MAG: GAF domain-containing protein [Cytophagaceae bacterium]|nr:MAG: GAF domain-containing protein [Cytophagaceae bacterium]